MTLAGTSTSIEVLLVFGLIGSAALWAMSSLYVVANRVVYDWRERRLIEIAQELTDPALATLDPLERSPAIRRILSRRSRRAAYRMVASPALPAWVTEICAAYALDRWGLDQMLLDASPSRRRRKWRRISALFALGHLRSPGVHDLLAAAICDEDPDVSAAATVVLDRLGDRPAAAILIDALRTYPHARSRIATQLDQFPTPIDDLLLPLLDDPMPHARFWAASLLIRYADRPRLAIALAPLAADPDAQVRKGVLETLGSIPDRIAARAIERRLGDPVTYVRSTAVRALARHAMMDRNARSRRTVASTIARSLADTAWEVRLATKEALAALGAGVWSEVATHLDSPDAFARNGAAEVLQNLGLLDRTMDEVGHGVEPSREVVEVLARAFREGGPAMIDAAVARSNPDLLPAIETLLARLDFVGTRSA